MTRQDLLQFIHDHHITQSALSRAAGKHPQAVSAFLRGVPSRSEQMMTALTTAAQLLANGSDMVTVPAKRRTTAKIAAKDGAS